MEIHAPHQPILSLQEALVHLGIVTIGILIALSLEGLVEWQHNRHLVREANENITAEIRDNNNELASFLSTAQQQLRKKEGHALDVIDAALAHHLPEQSSMELGFSRPDLTSASWNTAQSMGALGLMNYQDVKRYAAIYELQEEFLRLQARTIDALVDATTMFQHTLGPDKMSPSDLQTARQKILDLMANLASEEQIGEELHKRYVGALSH